MRTSSDKTLLVIFLRNITETAWLVESRDHFRKRKFDIEQNGVMSPSAAPLIERKRIYQRWCSPYRIDLCIKNKGNDTRARSIDKVLQERSKGCTLSPMGPHPLTNKTRTCCMTFSSQSTASQGSNRKRLLRPFMPKLSTKSMSL